MKIRKLLKNIYFKIPQKYRMGKKYWEIKRNLQEMQWWNEERIKIWQTNKLKEIIDYAYNYVPAYRESFRKAKIKPIDIKNLEDIKKIPITTKKMISNNLEGYSSTAIKKESQQYVSTSGSTGEPLGFYHTKLNNDKENAFVQLAWERFNWKMNERSIVLRGTFVGSKEKYFMHKSSRNELWMSSYFLNSESYYDYIRKIESFSAKHLRAYPSVAADFAELVIINNDIGKLKFNTIFLASECIYKWQKEVIQRAFPNSKLFSFYGQTEQVLFAEMCEYSEKYHVSPFYGLIEVIDENGREVDVNFPGEIIGTSFWNYATPFIRYNTGDLATKGKSKCSLCGRNYQMLESIDGRQREWVENKTGKKVYLTFISSIHSNVFDKIKQFQFSQESPGNLVLSIVKKENYKEKDTENIKIEFLKRLGDGFRIKFLFVDEIKKPISGKLSLLEKETK